MLVNKFQKFCNNKIDNYSIKRLEKFILKYLYKHNLGAKSSGTDDMNLKCYKKINNAISPNSNTFNIAMSNLFFKGFIEYTQLNSCYTNIKITLNGMEFLNSNHLFVKQLIITSLVSSIFSFIVGVITALIFNN